MTSEKLSANQLIFLIILFVLGSSIIMGVSNLAEQDSWLSIIMGIIIAIPVVVMYARIIKLNPGLSLFDIAENLFGKFWGKTITILFIWYAIHLGAMVSCNFTKYVELTTLLETPEIVVSIILLGTAFYLIKSKIQTFGKWGIVALPIMLIMVGFTVILSTKNINLESLMPMFDHKISLVINDTFRIWSFPLIEVVLFLCMADVFNKNDNPYKIYITAVVIGGVVLLIIFLRNLLVLGEYMNETAYFPSYVVARIIRLGEFITRIEGVITANFILAGVTKISVCLLAAAKGVSKLLKEKNYHKVVLPTALLMLTTCTILYPDIMGMFDFINVYLIYAFPFQIIIPVLIWITSEIKAKKQKKQS